jgi:hypothetical protein
MPSKRARQSFVILDAKGRGLIAVCASIKLSPDAMAKADFAVVMERLSPTQ